MCPVFRVKQATSQTLFKVHHITVKIQNKLKGSSLKKYLIYNLFFLNHKFTYIVTNE